MPNALNIRLSACHRLSQDADAVIYVRFTDPQERNEWLTNAKHLKDAQLSIFSICFQFQDNWKNFPEHKEPIIST